MDESQNPSLPLPPKRKSAFEQNLNLNQKIRTSLSQQEQEERLLEEEELEPKIDPELLAELEQVLKDTGSEVVIDLQDITMAITAPVLDNCLDPHTVPIHYLLEQARTEASPGQPLAKEADCE